MHNLEERRQADVDVDNVKGVLRLCFGINKDMVRVIAEAAAGCGDRRVNGDGGGAPVGGGGLALLALVAPPSPS